MVLPVSLTLLFNQYSIFDVLRGQEQKVREYVQKMPRDKILGASEQDLITALVADYWLNVPVLKEGNIADQAKRRLTSPWTLLPTTAPAHLPFQPNG
jgi:hypothetical protein